MKVHFRGCGTIRRVLFFMIPPGGYAQIEFDHEMSVNVALKMSGTVFKGQIIRVRQNNFIKLNKLFFGLFTTILFL